MPRPPLEIPLEDTTILGLKTLLEKKWTLDKIAEYYGVSKRTVSRRVQELKETRK